MGDRPETEIKRAGGLAYREAGPAATEAARTVVLLHGFPESSLMWESLMAALADAGHRSLAPDLYCLGESDDPGPATFERNLEQFGEWMRAQASGPVDLIVHDWGGFIGLAWACENPDLVGSLVISDTGFFADGRWHGPAQAIRAEGGEALVEAMDRDGFAALLRSDAAGFSDAEIDAYWRPFESGRGRAATVEFYRSMDFEKLEPYRGRLGEIAKPTLLLWGAEDQFAPIGGAHRLRKEIPGAQLVSVAGAGHFVFESEPERCRDEVLSFLGGPPHRRGRAGARRDRR